MKTRAPPRLALWLLKHASSPYHRESLIGDLLEQFAAGRSAAWYWREVGVALCAARLRALRIHALIRALLLALGVLALGFGTLTRADTTRSDTTRSDTAPSALTLPIGQI